MKRVTFTSDNEQKLNLLIQLAKELGVDVVQHYENAGDENTAAVSEADERYNTKVLAEVTDKHSEVGDDYCLPGPPISEEEMDAWLAKDDDEPAEYSIEDVLEYVKNELAKKRKG